MIAFRESCNNNRWKMLCEGHSGEAGASLECAAASALMAAAVNAVERYQAEAVIETGDGYCRVECAANVYTDALACMTRCGFEWLAAQAPGKVTCEALGADVK